MIRTRWSCRRYHWQNHQESDSSAESDESPPIPTEICDVKYLMGMGEQLGMKFARLIDTAQYAKAQA